MTFHSGFIGLIGLPNAGKSTLLNSSLQQKISIVSSKPQTTRNKILGIINSDGLQVALVDTPGIHRPRSQMHSVMVKSAKDLIPEMDGICWVVDVSKLVKKNKPLEERDIFSKGVGFIGIIAKEVDNLVIVLNKIDLIQKTLLLPIMASFQKEFPEANIIPISAKKNDGIEHLLGVFSRMLPEAPPMFPTEMITDVSERFLVSERIREKVFNLTNQEVPYSVAVEIQSFEEKKNKVNIYARIWVERDSQKGIIIGKGGSRLKEIGTKARQDIEVLLGTRVYLDLIVSVREKWTNNPNHLRQLGF
jgi:GTPase